MTNEVAHTVNSSDNLPPQSDDSLALEELIHRVRYSNNVASCFKKQYLTWSSPKAGFRRVEVYLLNEEANSHEETRINNTPLKAAQ